MWVADVDGDGKLDLLVGDSVDLHYPVDGLDEAVVREKLTAWETRSAALYEIFDGEEAPTEAAMKAFDAKYQQLQKERATFLRDDATGFVWLLRQK